MCNIFLMGKSYIKRKKGKIYTKCIISQSSLDFKENSLNLYSKNVFTLRIRRLGNKEFPK